MDNANASELAAWVDARLRAIDPPNTWRPDATSARMRVDARASSRPAYIPLWTIWAGAGSLICLLFLISPASRATAAQMWQRLTIGRIEIARVNFDDLPDDATSLRLETIVRPDPPAVVRDIAEAQLRAGFVPRLPYSALGKPERLSTMGEVSIGTIVRVDDLRLALHRADVHDEAVPDEWDGARLAMNLGPTVTAEWREISLMQGLPPDIVMPADFNFAAFARAVLRAAGMSRGPAQQLGRRMAEAPSLLLGISLLDDVAVREMRINGAPATMIEDFDDNGNSERVAVIWSASDRIYLLSGKITDEDAVAIATAVQ